MDTIGRLLSTAATSTDRTLRAELWADALVKILSCWIPVALSSFVVGGNLLIVSSLECFPMHLVSAVTTNADVNASSAEAVRDPRLYSKQLDEFVNVNCGKQTSFDYLVFTMMLVAQSVVMFAPRLLWDITRGREVICKLRFIGQYIEDLCKTLRPEDGKALDVARLSDQKPLKRFVKNLLKRNKIYYRYLALQLSTALLIVVFILVFCVVESGSVHSIQDNFKCSVSQEFAVDCTMSFASLYRIAWWTNMSSLMFSALTLFVHMFYLHCRLDDEPFKDVGIIFISKTSDNAERDASGSEQEPLTDHQPHFPKINIADHEASSFEQKAPTNHRSNFPKIKQVTDCHLMYAFLKANTDFIENYNYVAILLEILTELETQPQSP